MFDKLIDVVLDLAHKLVFLRVVSAWEGGVIVRLGRRRRVITAPGVVWLIPFVDDLLVTEVVPTTMTSDRKDFTTPSGRTLSVQVVITWRVHDVERFLLGVYDGKDAVLDAVTGTLGEVVESAGDEDTPSAIATRVKRRANARGKKWGVTFDRVQFASFVSARTYRLIGDTPRQD